MASPLNSAEHDRDDLVETETPHIGRGVEGLLDTVGDGGSKLAAVRDEPGADLVVADGTAPEVQQDELPFALLAEGLGQDAPDLEESLRAPPVGGGAGQHGANGLDPRQGLVAHHGEEEVVLTGEIGVDGAFGEARGRRDLVEARAGEATLGEDLQGGIEQAAADGLAPGPAGPRRQGPWASPRPSDGAFASAGLTSGIPHSILASIQY